MDEVLLAADGKDLSCFINFAQEYGMGLELQAFSNPRTLSNNWRNSLTIHKNQLKGFSGRIGLHGAFLDMNSASTDPAILRLTHERYSQNLVIAAELGAGYVVFHLNYLGQLKLNNYRPDWHRRQVDFWGNFAEQAASAGVPVLLENSWEDEPRLVTDILDEVNHPYLRACLDVAHATLYSQRDFDDWLKAFEPYLACCHLNNHDGRLDRHWPLAKGVVDYRSILAALRRLEERPLFCLEMPNVAFMEESLQFLELAPQKSLL